MQTGQHPAPFHSRTASLPSNLGRAAGRPALDSLPSSLFWADALWSLANEHGPRGVLGTGASRSHVAGQKPAGHHKQ